MAKKRRRKGKGKGNFSHHGSVTVDFFGFEEYLQKIADAEGNIVDAVVKAAKASAKPIEADLLGFIRPITREGDYVHTIDAFRNVHDMKKGYGIISYKLGFDKDNGGLPALFLDIGTPTITPSFFVYYAFRNNVDRVKAEQEEALKEVLRELM